MISLINVETVLLPNIHDVREEGSVDPEFRVNEFIDWHQLVRVWYEHLSEADQA